MIVQSFDRFGEVRELDLETCHLGPAGDGGATGASEVHGHYGALDGQTVILFRSGDGLRLLVGSSVIDVDDLTADHRCEGGRCTLTISDTHDGGVRTRIEYTAPDPIVAPEDDPTPFADAEDFDFGLFIANVVSDRQRKSTLYRSTDPR